MRRCFSLRSLKSLKTSTHPITSPCISRMGEAVSSMGTSLPSFAMSSVWFCSSTIWSSSNARRMGLATVSRVNSLMMTNTSSAIRPRASLCRHPVSFSATGLMNWMRPSTSTDSTPSPTDSSVALSFSLLSITSRCSCSILRSKPLMDCRR